MSSFPAIPAGLLALALAAAVAAQDPVADRRPVAFTNARLVTVSGATIERGTLVVRNGTIEAIGADVAVPPGARVVDATGATILPGLVSAWSRAGLGGQAMPREERGGGGRRGNRGGQPQGMGGGGGAQAKAASKVSDGLYPKQPVFGDLLEAGVTSLALVPMGSGFPGQGALLRPDGKTLEQLVQRDDAFLFVGMARESQTKKILKETFDKALKVVEERKKPPEPKPETPPAEAKPPEGKPDAPKPDAPKGETPPTPNPTPNPTPTPPTPTPNPSPNPVPPKPDAGGQGQPGQAGQPAPQKRPEPPKDPNLEVVADLLEGKRRALLQIDSAADVLHWQAAVPEAAKFPRTLVVTRHDPTSGTIDRAVDAVKAMGCAVLLPPDLTLQPRSRILVHPAKALHDAGIEIGFALGDNPAAVRLLFYRLTELVRHGLPTDVALKGVTLVPAKALGIDAKVGSLEVGKDANLLVFRGDPLAPTSELQSVWLRGNEVKKQP